MPNVYNEIICEYNENRVKGNEFIEIYDPDKIDDTKVTDIYALLVNNDIKKVSGSLYSLFLYLSDYKWETFEWKIIKIKGNDK